MAWPFPFEMFISCLGTGCCTIAFVETRFGIGFNGTELAFCLTAFARLAFGDCFISGTGGRGGGNVAVVVPFSSISVLFKGS